MKTRQVIARIVADSRPLAGKILLAALCIVLGIALSLVCPELLERLTDSLYAFWTDGTPIDWNVFWLLCGVLVAAYLFSALCSVLSTVLMTNSVTKHFTAGLRIRISDKIRRLPVSFLDATPSGEIISRMNSDVGTLGGTVRSFFEVAIDGFVRLIAITAVIFWKNPVVAALIVVFVPLSLILSIVLAGRSEKHFSLFREQNGKVCAFVEEDYTGFDTVKAFGIEERQAARHDELADDAAWKVRRGYYLNGLVSPAIMLVNNLGFAAICLAGGWLAVEGKLSVGAVVAFVLYAKMYASPLNSIAGGISMMQNAVAAARRVYALLDQEEVSEVARKAATECRGEVEFRDVNFSYVSDKPLIRHLSFRAKPGQKIAIVGPTGGGKTTIVNLLMRFYDPDSGAIFVDGENIMEMNRAELRDKFAMVLQDTWLFGGTVYENIAYGKENATREEVVAAAQKAHADRFIESLPEGYDTVIGEDAANISGGQKQLLTIARAYLANRRMLILDEATSNVDTRMELLIQRTMDELMEGRTSFVIAHRLSTILDADVILVVRDGQIVEQGKHEELLRRGGFYAEIYNSQYEAQN